MKICKICNIEKDFNCFEKNRRQCKDCFNKKHKEKRNAYWEANRLQTKLCIVCNIEKEFKFFNKIQAKCKDCEKEYKKQYYINNKEKIKIHIKEYCLNNKEKIKIKKNNYYLNNKETISTKSKVYRENNKEILKIRSYKYRETNKDIIKERKKQYRLHNKDILKAKKKIYYENNKKILIAKNVLKRRQIPYLRLRHIISSSILQSLKISNSYKNGSCKKYLPFTIKELKAHLESKFEPWMTWQNHGKYNSSLWQDNDQSTWTWQIDHIIPHSTFKYTNMLDQAFRDCWSLSNLRPLSAKQNLLDGINRTRHNTNITT